jgi:hypothetical protein
MQKLLLRACTLLTSYPLHLILQGSQPQQQAPDAAQIDKHAAAQQHENQPPTQTEVSTGSASLAAASGLLAIAGGGTAGKCKPGQVLGSSESDGTPHPEHSTPSAGPPSPHMRRQQQQQQQAQQPAYQQYQQQPLMLLQQQQMLLHLQAAGMQAMAPGACMVQGQPLMNATAQAANTGGMFFPAAATQQQQPGQPQVMAYPVMGPPGHVHMGNGTPAAAATADAANGAAAAANPGTTEAAAGGGSMEANGGAAAAAAGVKSEGDAAAAAANQANQSGCRRSLALRGPCYHCGTTISSQWRSGPPDKPVLCNACGLYYRKVQSLPDHTCQVAGALSVSARAVSSCNSCEAADAAAPNQLARMYWCLLCWCSSAIAAVWQVLCKQTWQQPEQAYSHHHLAATMNFYPTRLQQRLAAATHSLLYTATPRVP